MYPAYERLVTLDKPVSLIAHAANCSHCSSPRASPIRTFCRCVSCSCSSIFRCKRSSSATMFSSCATPRVMFLKCVCPLCGMHSSRPRLKCLTCADGTHSIHLSDAADENRQRRPVLERDRPFVSFFIVSNVTPPSPSGDGPKWISSAGHHENDLGMAQTG